MDETVKVQRSPRIHQSPLLHLENTPGIDYFLTSFLPVFLLLDPVTCVCFTKSINIIVISYDAKNQMEK